MKETTHARARTTPGPTHVIIILALLTVLWLAFGGDDWAAVFLGVPTVALALWAALHLSPSWEVRINPIAMAAFVPFFLKLSLVGGMDVALRAFSRRLRIDPGLIPYTLRLPGGTPRDFFILLISLLPGTLSADLEEGELTVHVLDRHQDNHAALAHLEERIARVFRVPLEDHGEGRA